jgi:hypothetical protein
MRSFRLWHPFVFAVHPVLFLFAPNADEVRPLEMLLPLSLTVLLAGLLLGTFALLLRDWTRGSLATTLLLFLFFSFGHAAGALEKLPFVEARAQLVAAILFVGAFLAASLWLVRTRRDPAPVATGLSIVAATLVGIQLVRAAPALVAPHADVDASSHAPVVAAPTAERNLPDIYFIVLDGYARADVMHDLYGFDIEPFLARLRELGFHVAGRSRSNYCKTLHCLTSILNMEYLQGLVTLDPLSVRSGPLLRLLRNNRVLENLRSLGYSVVTFSSGYSLVELPHPDRVLKPGLALSEFHSLLLETTPLPLLLRDEENLYALHRRRLDYILDELPQIGEGPRPRFVFAHLLAPHPPFVFDAEGQPVSPERPFGFYDGSDFYKYGGSREEYVRAYAAQARYVTRRLEEALTALVQPGERAPVILLQSDHGPGSRLDWRSIPDTDLQERFGILFAAHLPGVEGLSLPDDASPVNTFRLVFDLYFGSDLGPLEHRSYYTFQSRPFQYIDVTDSSHPQ